MTKHYVIFCILLAATAFSQTRFEKGYFIDNQNRRTECLIKNGDWNDTPSEFEYKLIENDPASFKKDKDVTEFGFADVKYISTDVDIDFSGSNANRLSKSYEPEFQRVRVFLKLITDGNAKLYYYRKNDLQRYLYSIDNGKVQQLIFKKYQPNDEFDVAFNNSFRQQLWSEVKCGTTSLEDMRKITYTRNDLVAYFEKVNLCNGSMVLKKAEKKKGSFNIKASLMFGSHSLSVDVETTNNSPGAFPGHDFGKKSYVSFGAEAEYIFPFWNNKWSAIIEPTFNSFKSDPEAAKGGDMSVEIKYIQFVAGFRHYMFLNSNSKIFLNGQLSYAIVSEQSNVFYQRAPPFTSSDLLEFGSNSITFALGAGYNYRRFYLEARYYTPGNPTPYAAVTYKYNKSELILRYRIL